MITLSPLVILRRKPFREQSLLLDIWTRDAGKFTCVAKASKQARSKAILEPLRLLEGAWAGKGEVLSLHKVEEQQRFALPPANLSRALYLNEVLLRSLWAHQAQPKLFDAYLNTLQRLTQLHDSLAMPLFELNVLHVHGYVLNLWQDDATGQDIQPQMRYRFLPDRGLAPDQADVLGVPLSGTLLIGLRTPASLTQALQHELRQVLDRLFSLLLQGKVLHARRLINENN
jgi:DNA repair protein RecO (recombination protein O)